MAKRLKVYRTTAGFYETVVAVANQSDALKAWGVRQNLFAEDAAEVETDPDVVTLANAHPGQVLRRPIGSKETFKLDPDTPAAPKGGKAKPKAKADRRKLDAAETAFEKLQQTQRAEADEFDRRIETLKADRAAAESRWNEEKGEAKKAIDQERRAYREAGGR